MLKKLLFIFFCLSLYPLFAQVNNDISQESTFSVISTDFNQNEEMNIYKQLLSEIQMQKQDLEKENEQIQKALTISNQAFDRVTNAYWALFGIIISIALFVLGGNFIFQTINQKKISKSILDDVLSKSMEEIDKINKKMNKKCKILLKYLIKIITIKQMKQ